MYNKFHTKLLKKCNILSLKKNNNIIVETNIPYYEKLNAKIVNIDTKSNIIHVIYYGECNTTILINDDKDCHDKDCHDIIMNDHSINEHCIAIDVNKNTIYKPYPTYPFFSEKKLTKYGNKFVIEYYNEIQKINDIQLHNL